MTEAWARTCTCGHAEDKHGSKDPKNYPGATECLVEDCGCIAFEWDWK